MKKTNDTSTIILKGSLNLSDQKRLLQANPVHLPQPNTTLVVGGNWIYDDIGSPCSPARIEIGNLPQNDPKRKKILDKYYTLNPNGFADFNIGIDNPDILKVLPPHYFKEIYFERIPSNILMNR